MESNLMDLHIHSNFSDGTSTWQDILRQAEAAGLQKISITDHDNCDVYFHITDPQKYFSGEIITGIEMQAYYRGFSIEMLGYEFDPHKMRDAIQGLYLPFSEINRHWFTRLVTIFEAIGIQLGDTNYTNQRHYSTHFLHDEMRKIPENRKKIPDEESWQSYHIFYRRHMSNPASPFYIDESDITPSADKVMDIIRQTGGKVVLPHVFQYEENAEMMLQGLLPFLDGIECYYPGFTSAQTSRLLELCEERGLFATGGSDYHGNTRENRIGIFPNFVAKGRQI